MDESDNDSEANQFNRIFIYCNPPNALRSKKAMLRKRDIPAMSMNCQYI